MTITAASTITNTVVGKKNATSTPPPKAQTVTPICLALCFKKSPTFCAVAFLCRIWCGICFFPDTFGMIFRQWFAPAVRTGFPPRTGSGGHPIQSGRTGLKRKDGNVICLILFSIYARNSKGSTPQTVINNLFIYSWTMCDIIFILTWK